VRGDALACRGHPYMFVNYVVDKNPMDIIKFRFTELNQIFNI
jgi:hypothetical protein